MEWSPFHALSRKRRKDYTIVPTEPARHFKRRRSRVLHAVTLRRLLFCLACAPFLVIFAIFCQGIPPSYDDIRTFERRLPQHSIAALTRVDDRPARYLRFPGHLWGHGLNNVLQEACVFRPTAPLPCSPIRSLLMSYLAYFSNVSFVFEDYTWSHSPLPWTVYGFALRPSRIPINAIVAGPTAGGPILGPSQAPLAVSAEFYERVCSSPDIVPYVLSSANAPNDADGAVVIEYWQAQLARVDAHCIEIDSSTRDLFDRL